MLSRRRSIKERRTRRKEAFGVVEAVTTDTRPSVSATKQNRSLDYEVYRGHAHLALLSTLANKHGGRHSIKRCGIFMLSSSIIPTTDNYDDDAAVLPNLVSEEFKTKVGEKATTSKYCCSTSGGKVNHLFVFHASHPRNPAAHDFFPDRRIQHSHIVFWCMVNESSLVCASYLHRQKITWRTS